MYMFTINTSPWGWELEEGIPNELCRILDVYLCVRVFFLFPPRTRKKVSNRGLIVLHT